MNLEKSIRLAYGGFIGYVPSRHRYDNVQYLHCDTAYLEIPITSPVFEVPVFAIDKFDNALTNGYDNQEAIVIRLSMGDKESRYTTVGRAMQDLIRSEYNSYALIPISVKQGNNEVHYFVTQGAVFDESLKALAMFSWLIEWHKDDEESSFKLVRPILRVSPDCYLEKANQMEKLIANKMINTVLSRTVDYPNTVQIANELCLQEVKVEICNSPFHIRKADVPSISTTTKKLLSTAAEYLDEII